MKKIFLILVFIPLFNLFGFSQTYDLTIQSSSFNNPIWSTYFTDASTGYAVCNKGTIVKTENGGLTWTQQSSGTNNNLYSVFFANATTGWIVGSSCTILKTINGGSTWIQQSSGLSNDHFNSVYFTNANTGYIVTTRGSILKTTDGGSTWSNQRNQCNPFLFSVFFTDANAGFVVGGTGTNGNTPSVMKILKTTNGGALWSEITNGVTDGVLRSVHFVNSSTGFAVGIKNNGKSAVLKTTDGGTTWTESTIPTAYYLRSVFFIDTNTGFCTGNGGFIFRTTDGGVNWTDVSELTMRKSNQGLYSNYFINSNLGWITCSNGSMIKYTSPSASSIIQAPTLTTSAASSITSATATSGGNISTDGGASVTARGVCWSTSQNPTTADSKTTDGSGIGVFTSSITELTANTTYYVRAYATNSVGTSYGSQVSFISTASSNTVTDCDGNVYHTITIGTQTWMVENLKTTKYNDCTVIPNVTDNTAWIDLTTPAYCWYLNDAATNKDTYGALYNWYTINTGKLCPIGWHVPTDAEWTTLITYLGGEAIAGGKLKEIGLTHWHTPNTAADNTSGFTALPGGYRGYQSIGYHGFWWSFTESDATHAWLRLIYYDNSTTWRNSETKGFGFSVRCIKD